MSITTTSGDCSSASSHDLAAVGGFAHHREARLPLQQQRAGRRAGWCGRQPAECESCVPFLSVSVQVPSSGRLDAAAASRVPGWESISKRAAQVPHALLHAQQPQAADARGSKPLPSSCTLSIIWSASLPHVNLHRAGLGMARAIVQRFLHHAVDAGLVLLGQLVGYFARPPARACRCAWRSRGPASRAPAPGRNRPAWRAAAAAPCCGFRSCPFRPRRGSPPGAARTSRAGSRSSRFSASISTAENDWPTSSCSSRESARRSSSWARTSLRGKLLQAGLRMHAFLQPRCTSPSSRRIWKMVRPARAGAAQQRDGDHGQQPELQASRTRPPSFSSPRLSASSFSASMRSAICSMEVRRGTSSS